MHRAVAHDALFPDLVAAGLELGLDERDDLAAGQQDLRHRRQDQLQGDLELIESLLILLLRQEIMVFL